MKRRHWLQLVAAALAAVGGAAVLYREPVQTLPPAQVERRDLERVVRITGEVINDRRVALTALVDGQVRRVQVGRGANVEADQVLASMDNRAAEARVAGARATLRQQEIYAEAMRRRLQRLNGLSARDAVAEETLDEARLQWEAATAARDLAHAELSLAKVMKDWQQVRAPFDAVVVDKTTEVGQWVEAGTDLFELVALEGRVIEAHVDAVDSGRVRLGQSVSIRCDAFPDRVWQSHLDWIGPSVEREKDNLLNSFRVRLPLGEEAPPLLLGQQLDLEIRVDRREQVLTLPFAALQERDGRFEVAMIDDGRVRYQTIEIGLEGENRVEILAGLPEGQPVVRLDGELLEPRTRARFSAAQQAPLAAGNAQ